MGRTTTIAEQLGEVAEERGRSMYRLMILDPIAKAGEDHMESLAKEVSDNVR